MKAVILAGGKGRRLAPFTVAFPKPLVPVGNRPVLEILLRKLASHGIKEVVLSVDHLAELIMAFIEGSPSLKELLHVRYIRDEQPGGTAGPLANIPGLEETFLVLNGDVLTTLDLGALLQFHQEEKAALTIAVHRKETPLDLGVLSLEGTKVVAYQEKPKLYHDVSMGVYVYEPKVLEYIEPGVYLDFPTLVLRLLAEGEKVVGYRSEAFWLDIGRPEDYERAQKEFSQSG